jgi:predicted SAM-dependent methyltransferase
VAIRLNVGCGNKKLDGYLGCDFGDNYSGDQPDVVCDIRELPFDNDFADEVLAVHVLEHFYVWEAEDVVNEWIRVLKPGGKLVIEVPCLDKIINHYIKFEGAPPVNLSMWGLYGDPSYKDERMCHRWCYSVNQLKALLDQVGMKEIIECEPKFHVAIRDMRVEAIK